MRNMIVCCVVVLTACSNGGPRASSYSMEKGVKWNATEKSYYEANLADQMLAQGLYLPSKKTQSGASSSQLLVALQQSAQQGNEPQNEVEAKIWGVKWGQLHGMTAGVQAGVAAALEQAQREEEPRALGEVLAERLQNAMQQSLDDIQSQVESKPEAARSFLPKGLQDRVQRLSPGQILSEVDRHSSSFQMGFAAGKPEGAAYGKRRRGYEKGKEEKFAQEKEAYEQRASQEGKTQGQEEGEREFFGEDNLREGSQRLGALILKGLGRGLESFIFPAAYAAQSNTEPDWVQSEYYRPQLHEPTQSSLVSIYRQIYEEAFVKRAKEAYGRARDDTLAAAKKSSFYWSKIKLAKGNHDQVVKEQVDLVRLGYLLGFIETQKQVYAEEYARGVKQGQKRLEEHFSQVKENHRRRSKSATIERLNKSPHVLAKDLKLADEDGDGILVPGEGVVLELNLSNHGRELPASQVKVSVKAQDRYFTQDRHEQLFPAVPSKSKTHYYLKLPFRTHERLEHVGHSAGLEVAVHLMDQQLASTSVGKSFNLPFVITEVVSPPKVGAGAENSMMIHWRNDSQKVDRLLKLVLYEVNQQGQNNTTMNPIMSKDVRWRGTSGQKKLTFTNRASDPFGQRHFSVQVEDPVTGMVLGRYQKHVPSTLGWVPQDSSDLVMVSSDEEKIKQVLSYAEELGLQIEVYNRESRWSGINQQGAIIADRVAREISDTLLPKVAPGVPILLDLSYLASSERSHFEGIRHPILLTGSLEEGAWPWYDQMIRPYRRRYYDVKNHLIVEGNYPDWVREKESKMSFVSEEEDKKDSYGDPAFAIEDDLAPWTYSNPFDQVTALTEIMWFEDMSSGDNFFLGLSPALSMKSKMNMIAKLWPKAMEERARWQLDVVANALQRELSREMMGARWSGVKPFYPDSPFFKTLQLRKFVSLFQELSEDIQLRLANKIYSALEEARDESDNGIFDQRDGRIDSILEPVKNRAEEAGGV